jgi:hypothetical protein
MSDYEAFNVERVAHRTIGDRLFVVMEGFIGSYQGRDRPRGVPLLFMQYEIRNVTVPFSKTVERMMLVRDGDFLWIKYREHAGELGIKARSTYVVTDVKPYGE